MQLAELPNDEADTSADTWTRRLCSIAVEHLEHVLKALRWGRSKANTFRDRPSQPWWQGMRYAGECTEL